MQPTRRVSRPTIIGSGRCELREARVVVVPSIRQTTHKTSNRSYQATDYSVLRVCSHAGNSGNNE